MSRLTMSVLGGHALTKDTITASENSLEILNMIYPYTLSLGPFSTYETRVNILLLKRVS